MRKSASVRGLVLAIAVAFATPCVEAAASKTGWWIRVEKRKTEASVSFQIGTDKKDRHVWRTWRPSDETEFDVPEELLQVETLYIQAIANPDDSDSSFCVFYRGNGVLQFDFDEQQEDRMQQKDHDRGCKN